MNDIQKNWLLDNFFKKEEFAGWRGIAERLIDKGSCVTTKCGDAIWIGGIGNFISSEPYTDGIDLIKLTFDVKKFISRENKFFMEKYIAELKEVEEKQRKFIEYKRAINSLTKF